MYKKGEFGKSTMRSLTYTAVPFTVVKIPVLLLLFCLLNSSLPPVLLLVPLFFFLFLDTGKNDTARTSTVYSALEKEGGGEGSIPERQRFTAQCFRERKSHSLRQVAVAVFEFCRIRRCSERRNDFGGGGEKPQSRLISSSPSIVRP